MEKIHHDYGDVLWKRGDFVALGIRLCYTISVDNLYQKPWGAYQKMILNNSPVIWNGHYVMELLQGTGPSNWEATGVSIDTRTLKPGDLFIALQGPNFDGHDFTHKALALGACAVIVQTIDPRLIGTDQPVIVVPDTIQALTQLAKAARARFLGRILALTGSVGKTSVKDGLAHVLSKQGETSASLHSLNNHLGVPLSLARLPQDARYAIFEVGMNHAGEIEQLVQLIHPHIALITQVSYQHGQFFSSIDAIVDAKAEIFSGLPPLVGILPHDSPHYSALRNQERNNVTGWITFGRHSASNVRLISTVCQGDKTQVTIEINKEQLSYHWPLDGAHTLDNSLAIVAGAWAIGADMHQVMNDLSTITPSKGRGSRLNLRGISIIDESYNAAPASMHAVLTAFAQEQCPGKRYLLLGEMRELGAQSYALHSALIPLMHACCLDGVWLCGNEFQPFLEEVPQLCGHGLGIDDLLPSILETLRPGDCILIKGANCMRTFALIDALKE